MDGNKAGQKNRRSEIMESTTRKVYVNHPLHGTCITLSSQVYTAPAGVTFDKKADNRITVASTDGDTVLDSEGRIWPKKGFNPGCGARCPAEIRGVAVTKFLADHGAALTEEARFEIGAAPGTEMRQVWIHISNETRKLCIAATKPAAK